MKALKRLGFTNLSGDGIIGSKIMERFKLRAVSLRRLELESSNLQRKQEELREEHVEAHVHEHVDRTGRHNEKGAVLVKVDSGKQMRTIDMSKLDSQRRGTLLFVKKCFIVYNADDAQ